MTRSSMLSAMVALLLVGIGVLSLLLILRPVVHSTDQILLSPNNVVLQRLSSSQEDAEQTVSLLLENRTDKVVKILRATSNCGCTVPAEVNGRDLRPYSSVQIPVTAQIPSHGEKDVIIAIETSDPSHPIVQSMLILKGIPIELPRIVSQPKEVTLVVAESLAVRGVHESLSFTLEEQRSKSAALEGCAGQDIGLAVTSVSVVDESPGNVDGSVFRRYSVQLELTETATSKLLATKRLYDRLIPQFHQEVNFIPEHIPVSIKITPDVIANPSAIVFHAGTDEVVPLKNKQVEIQWAKGITPVPAIGVRSSQPWIQGIVTQEDRLEVAGNTPRTALTIEIADRPSSSSTNPRKEWLEIDFEGNQKPLNIPVYLEK